MQYALGMYYLSLSGIEYEVRNKRREIKRLRDKMDSRLTQKFLQIETKKQHVSRARKTIIALYCLVFCRKENFSYPLQNVLKNLMH